MQCPLCVLMQTVLIFVYVSTWGVVKLEAGPLNNQCTVYCVQLTRDVHTSTC